MNQTFELAGKLQLNKDYEKAILAYQRVIYFDGTDEFAFNSAYQTAVCYAALQNIVKATDFYDRAYYLTENDSLKTEITLQKAACLISGSMLEQALVELLSLNSGLADSHSRSYQFYLGITYFKLGRFDESSEHIYARYNRGQTEVIAKLDRIFHQAEKINKLSPKTAKILSTILPGSGQLYAGDIQNGANSLLLLTGLALLARNIALNYSVFDAIMSVMPWYQRYFTGGFNLAEQITIDKKRLKLNELSDQLIDITISAELQNNKSSSGSVFSLNKANGN